MTAKPKITRPSKDECAPFYHGYLEQAPGEDAFAVLCRHLESTASFLRQIPAEKWDYRYAPGKWTLKESFIHLLDSERIFAYRALRISRNDRTPLPGFEQDDYIPYYGADQRSPESIVEEYQVVRRATIALFQHLDEAAIGRWGVVGGNPMSVRALAWIIVGHEQHHLNLAVAKYLGG